MLVRSGNTFTGYRSADGVIWMQQGVATNFMLSTVYAGLAVTSHNTASLCAATFDGVAVPGWTVSTPPMMRAQLTGSNMTLSWPLTNANLALQCCTNLASRNWQAVSFFPPQIVGGQWQVTLPLSAANSAFYRLVK